jgi:hypothetical protein
MSVVAKMQCHMNESRPQSDPEQPHLSQIRLGGVWEGSTEKQRASENAIFGHWTPSASVDMSIRNPEAADFFKPGKKYYVTFTEAPD